MANIKLAMLIDVNSNSYTVLAVHSYNDAVKDNNGSSFMIPSYVKLSSTYTIYWIWNTINNSW